MEKADGSPDVKRLPLPLTIALPDRARAQITCPM